MTTSSWVNAAGASRFTDLAAQYATMVSKVDASADAAAEKHLAQPMRSAGAHSAVQTYMDGSALHVGIPDDHPEAEEALQREFGTPTTMAGGQIRHTLRTNMDAARGAFEQGLVQ